MSRKWRNFQQTFNTAHYNKTTNSQRTIQRCFCQTEPFNLHSYSGWWLVSTNIIITHLLHLKQRNKKQARPEKIQSDARGGGADVRSIRSNCIHFQVSLPDFSWLLHKTVPSRCPQVEGSPDFWQRKSAFLKWVGISMLILVLTIHKYQRIWV